MSQHPTVPRTVCYGILLLTISIIALVPALVRDSESISVTPAPGIVSGVQGLMCACGYIN